MRTGPLLASALAAITLDGTVAAQSFSLSGAPETAPETAPGTAPGTGSDRLSGPATPADPGPAPGRDAWFVLAPPAPKLAFSFLPPARKMFVDPAGNVALFPALFPNTVHFRELGAVPGFFAGRFRGAFTAWRVGDLHLALAEGYTLYSATVRDGRLFVMARDADGDFVALDPAHFAVARADGAPLAATPAPATQAIVAVLVDRSQSMDGFDPEMAAAIDTLAGTLRTIGTGCALYEFGRQVRTVRSAREPEPCGALFERYALPEPAGGTPLFAAMDRAYADLRQVDALSAVVILSDGAPSDTPAPGLRERARRIPTLVLWAGHHTTDHIAAFSTAHAISRDGAKDDIAAFLASATAAVSAHQAFTLSSP